MESLSTGAADSAESSARRTARAGARREPCTLNGHSSTKVGLEPESIGKETVVEAVRAGGTAMDQTTFVVRAGSPSRVEGRIACRLHCQQRTATEGCHDPEPILTDLLSRE